MRHRSTLAALALATALAVTACGGDDDDDDKSTDTTAASEADAPDDTEADDAPDDTEADVADDTTDDTEADVADDTAADDGLTEDEIRALCDAFRPGLGDACVADGGPMNVAYGLEVDGVTAELALFVDNSYRTGILNIDTPADGEPVCSIEVTAVEETSGAEMFAFLEGDTDTASACTPPNFSFTVEFPSDLVLSPGDTFTLHLNGAAAGAMNPIE